MPRHVYEEVRYFSSFLHLHMGYFVEVNNCMQNKICNWLTLLNISTVEYFYYKYFYGLKITRYTIHYGQNEVSILANGCPDERPQGKMSTSFWFEYNHLAVDPIKPNPGHHLSQEMHYQQIDFVAFQKHQAFWFDVVLDSIQRIKCKKFITFMLAELVQK